MSPRIIGLGHALFALAAASLAVLSFVYGDFASSWHFMPHFQGREILLGASVVILATASAGLCFSRTALPSAVTIGAYHAVWAVLAAPAVVSQPLSVDAWYGFCGPMTWLLGASILYTLLRWPARGSDLPAAGKRIVRASQVLLGLTWVFYGLSHFVYAEFTASMVPVGPPYALALAYLTGVCHIAAGIGIIVGILPRLSATLEAIMLSLFGLLVWVPSFLMQPRPKWAGTVQNQWSELAINLLLSASAWIVVDSLRNRPWLFASRSPVNMPQRSDARSSAPPG